MAYRNKTYVAFDGDNDINYYRLMTAWKENSNIVFKFNDAHNSNNIWHKSSEETIKRRLRERMANTKMFILLIGEHTKNLYKYVRWEIEYAIEKDIPIIGVNLNGAKEKDDYCPAILKNELAIFVPFKQKIIDFALNDWESSHKKYRSENKSGSYHYSDKVYNDLGLN